MVTIEFPNLQDICFLANRTKIIAMPCIFYCHKIPIIVTLEHEKNIILKPKSRLQVLSNDKRIKH